MIVGAGASGQAALQTVNDYSPEANHSLVAMIAGGEGSALQAAERAANDYDAGLRDMQLLSLSANDMLLALTVSGNAVGVGSHASRLVAGDADCDPDAAA